MSNFIKESDISFKEELKKRINPNSFNTWIRPVKILLIDEDEGSVTLQVPSKFHVEFIKGQFKKQVLESLCSTLKTTDLKVKYLIDSDTNFEFSTQEKDTVEEEIKPPKAKQETSYMPTFTDTSSSTNVSVNPNYTSFTQPPTPSRRPTPSDNPEKIEGYDKTNLNPKYTFDNFIQGNGNETAYASALQVAKDPRNSRYNPLLIFGGVGLGKTHIVSAIGNHAFKNGLCDKILYIPSDQFVMEIVNSIKNKTIDEYKSYLKEKDIIIVDDIQFFARKEKSQEELFHIFNYIYNNHGQIILTSDFHPNDIHQMDDRLKSRFKMGLITDVRPPDLETRAAIIRLKAEELNFTLKDEVIMFIANNINTNVRDLEGAVIKLSFHQTYMKTDTIDTNKAKELLKELITSKKSTLNIDKIQDIVSEYFNIPKDLLMKKNRTKEVADARAIAMYLCTTQLKATTQSIGANFGNREHSTVSHAAKKIQKKLNAKDQETLKVMEEILNIINLKTC